MKAVSLRGFLHFEIGALGKLSGDAGFTATGVHAAGWCDCNVCHRAWKPIGPIRVDIFGVLRTDMACQEDHLLGLQRGRSAVSGPLEPDWGAFQIRGKMYEHNPRIVISPRRRHVVEGRSRDSDAEYGRAIDIIEHC